MMRRDNKVPIHIRIDSYFFNNTLLKSDSTIDDYKDGGKTEV